MRFLCGRHRLQLENLCDREHVSSARRSVEIGRCASKGSPKDLKGENHGLRILARRYRHRRDAAALYNSAATALLKRVPPREQPPCSSYGLHITHTGHSSRFPMTGSASARRPCCLGVSVNVCAHRAFSKNSRCRSKLAARGDHGAHRRISPGVALHAWPRSEMAAETFCVNRPIEVSGGIDGQFAKSVAWR
jgi:hypothetical protein